MPQRIYVLSYLADDDSPVNICSLYVRVRPSICFNSEITEIISVKFGISCVYKSLSGEFDFA
jgi:hypothetical protein